MVKTHKQQIIENTIGSLISAGMPSNLAEGFVQILSNVYEHGRQDAFDSLKKQLTSAYPATPVPQITRRDGCRICGIGANGEVIGYVCPRGDCPTKVTTQYAIL